MAGLQLGYGKVKSTQLTVGCIPHGSQEADPKRFALQSKSFYPVPLTKHYTFYLHDLPTVP